METTPEPVRHKNLKGFVEAALFVTHKPFSPQELADLLQVELYAVEEALMELIRDYSIREDSALEIDDSEGYILQVREEYAAIVNKMIPIEISPGALRTLSAIAIKAPVVQSDLVELRGSGTYEHIHELLAKKLISKRREGRSYVLNVTRNFHEYFKLMGDKKDLLGLVRQESPVESFHSS